MTITIFNSKGKVQKRFTKVSSKLAFSVLARIQGKEGWWAKAEYKNGDGDILLYVNGEWKN